MNGNGQKLEAAVEEQIEKDVYKRQLMDCKECHERFRADKIIEDYCA